MPLLKQFAVAALALLLVPLHGAVVSPEVAGDYKIKAVFLFNFSQFVDWPAAAFSAAGAPFVIGVLGEDPFGPYLDQAVTGEVVDGRPLTVARYRQAGDIKFCHILFISRSEGSRLSQILDSVKGRSILTVSDLDGFADRGGMIQLVRENNRIRLKVNLQAAKAANLTISSKLLRPGSVVAARNH